MTHIFEVGTNFYNQVKNRDLYFDILQFGPRVSVGDTVIYQRLADTEEEELDEELDEEQINDTHVSGDEICVVIEHLFDDSDKCLKKGFTAFQFKEKE